jgi:hypothetical protein
MRSATPPRNLHLQGALLFVSLNMAAAIILTQLMTLDAQECRQSKPYSVALIAESTRAREVRIV